MLQIVAEVCCMWFMQSQNKTGILLFLSIFSNAIHPCHAILLCFDLLTCLQVLPLWEKERIMCIQVQLEVRTPYQPVCSRSLQTFHTVARAIIYVVGENCGASFLLQSDRSNILLSQLVNYTLRGKCGFEHGLPSLARTTILILYSHSPLFLQLSSFSVPHVVNCVI